MSVLVIFREEVVVIVSSRNLVLACALGSRVKSPVVECTEVQSLSTFIFTFILLQYFPFQFQREVFSDNLLYKLRYALTKQEELIKRMFCCCCC